ncbi:hypothetical protein B0H19DRAFT_1056977 [Mycena capillaripes]|nr:hypothetical protein B0H19DRAFT_1056977 [Mycena capillaripes]
MDAKIYHVHRCAESKDVLSPGRFKFERVVRSLITSCADHMRSKPELIERRAKPKPKLRQGRRENESESVTAASVESVSTSRTTHPWEDYVEHTISATLGTEFDPQLEVKITKGYCDDGLVLGGLPDLTSGLSQNARSTEFLKVPSRSGARTQVQIRPMGRRQEGDRTILASPGSTRLPAATSRRGVDGSEEQVIPAIAGVTCLSMNSTQLQRLAQVALKKER